MDMGDIIIIDWNIKGDKHMEKIIKLKIEKLPEGVYLATSDDVQGLVAQGKTLVETIEIAKDVAKKLLELQGNDTHISYQETKYDKLEIPIVIGT